MRYSHTMILLQIWKSLKFRERGLIEIQTNKKIKRYVAEGEKKFFLNFDFYVLKIDNILRLQKITTRKS